MKSVSCVDYDVFERVDATNRLLYQRAFIRFLQGPDPIFVSRNPLNAEEHYGFVEAGRGREEVDPHRRRRRRGGPSRDLHRQPSARQAPWRLHPAR
ncbi:hypothetical protein BREVUG8_110782 [Brevundimonas sp. G8]|nr:hypothetical protein BREVUG8_110782 [Brevundimonas sp. G8]